MKTSDKFLIGIVVTIILIVVAAFVVTLTRPQETYQPDDSPENIVHNYLLAVQQDDYERAYSYLSPEIRHYPASVVIFERQVNDYSWDFRLDQDITLSVAGATIKEDRATVEVTETRFYGGGLFDTGQAVSTFEMDLILIEGNWKISNGDAYFVYCWNSASYCR